MVRAFAHDAMGRQINTSHWMIDDWAISRSIQLSKADIVSTLKGLNIKMKEVFYLTTHTTHYIYGYMASA